MSSLPPLRLHPDDQVGVLRTSQDGDVPAGHKVALVDLPAGTLVRKYGFPIGVTTTDVRAGEHVHTHNLASLATRPAVPVPAHGGPVAATPPSPGGPAVEATFAGIVRPDGRVGTRNYVAVVSSVNCSATAVRRIAASFDRPGVLDDHPGVDGVIALTHGSGCGLADGEGLALLRRTIAGYARHPNVAGVALLGLGCEVNQVTPLLEEMALPEGIPVRVATIQEQGGTRAAIDWGVAAVGELLDGITVPQRQPVPAGALTLGLNCGGSDAWSGLTANPVLGVASDLLIGAGGTAILGETPEIHGAEHLLTARAVAPEVARRLEERLAWWEAYAAANGTDLDANPSPGNRAGGITTIEEKSLGAVAKAGSSPLCAVVGYAEPVTSKGLVFMDTPGFDPVSVTGIVAGGATVVCFTTGRGSVFGCKPAPSIKLATTSDLYRRMADDMDFDAGRVLEDGTPVDQLGRELFERILAVASGEPTKSEELGFGDEEFAPWLLGATL